MEEDTRGRMLLEREERKLERAKAKLAATERHMTETIAALLRKENVKRALAKDAMEATRDRNRRDKMFDIAGSGAYNDDQDGIITGDEPRPWEH